MEELENIPAEEPLQIERVVRLTFEQMRNRYPGGKPILRSVHAKDHGCLHALFTVRPDLPAGLRIGLFSTPAREYQAWIRFSNAAPVVAADSPTTNGETVHGSRGMAIKVMGVSGAPLLPLHGALTQDFLMVNHPVFPIANVEDYLALTEIVGADKENPARFFAERIRKDSAGAPDASDPMTQRTVRTLTIVKRIQSLGAPGQPPPFQPPSGNPLDNTYFSAAPFLFGRDRVMKFRVLPAHPVASAPPALSDPDYLRTALRQRLSASGAKTQTFDFQVQLRTAAELRGQVGSQIEDACCLWDESRWPFVSVAAITIPPQDFDAVERRSLCESLVFTPWHGIQEHRPLGGINRMRRAVYEASAACRHIPKEPADY